MQCNVVEKKEKIVEHHMDSGTTVHMVPSTRLRGPDNRRERSGAASVMHKKATMILPAASPLFSSGKNSPGTASSVISAGSRTKKTFRIEDSEVQEAQASSGLLSGHKPACSLMLSFGTLTSKAEQVTWATELDVWAEEIQESDLRLAMTVLQRRVLDLESLNC